MYRAMQVFLSSTFQKVPNQNMAARILVIYIEAELALLYAAPPENTKEKRAQDFVDRAKKSLLSALPPWCVVGQLTA